VEEAGLKAIASAPRRAMLRLVWDREQSSGDIAAHFGMSWPAVSQNLQVLERAGLVRCRRRGTTRLYRADRAKLGPLKAVLVKMWEADLDRLAELAEAETKGRRR
jgi:DNA-binding transcriptional ArsR family regulator